MSVGSSYNILSSAPLEDVVHATSKGPYTAVLNMHDLERKGLFKIYSLWLRVNALMICIY